MIYGKLHPKGPTFSRLIAGAWRWHTVPTSTLERLIATCLDLGINTFDHADIYGDHGNEKIFGDVLRAQPHLRDKMQIITKCGIKFPSSQRPNTRVKHYDSSCDHIILSVENSLKMLNVEKIDLLLIHRPDPLLNPVEVSEAFMTLKLQGKVLHFGVSNFTPQQFEMLQSHLSFPLIGNQIEISLFEPQLVLDGTLDSMMKLHAGIMAWSPLGGGKYLAGETEASRRVLDGLQQFGPRFHAGPAEMLLAWLMRHPGNIFPVIGTTKPDRITESIKSLDIRLDRQDWFEMLKWVTGKDVA